MDQPNVGADVHLSTLQCCVHSQVDWVGCLAAVVLVNEHWVFCDVKACGIPVTDNAKTVRTEIDPNKFYRKINFVPLTYHPMMTSEGETLLWSSYMFFANSMSTATCQQKWKVYKKKKKSKRRRQIKNILWFKSIQQDNGGKKRNLCGHWCVRKHNFMNLIFLYVA